DSGGLFAGQDRNELGVGNRLLLAEDRLRENLRAVQLRNDIEVTDPATAPAARELFDVPAKQGRGCPHFPSRWRPAPARPTSARRPCCGSNAAIEPRRGVRLRWV